MGADWWVDQLPDFNPGLAAIRKIAHLGKALPGIGDRGHGCAGLLGRDAQEKKTVISCRSGVGEIRT